MSPLHLKFGKVRADSGRLLQFRGSRREISVRENRTLPLTRLDHRGGGGEDAGVARLPPGL